MVHRILFFQAIIDNQPINDNIIFLRNVNMIDITTCHRYF